MNDSYVNFANTGIGARLTSMLGLPQPLVLERHTAGQAILNAPILLGACAVSELGEALRGYVSDMSLELRLHASATQSEQAEAWQAPEKIKALVFDASGFDRSSQSGELHAFFSQTVRSVLPNGRVIIIGRPPSDCETPSKAIAQRSLEGLSRSLAKELKKAITVQLVYVAEGAENQLGSTLRFLLSAKSSYVSAQVISVSKSTQQADPTFNWSQSMADKKVLVTGASQGIGAAISEVMSREGAQLVCLDTPQASVALSEITKRLNARAIELDLSADNAAELLVDAAKEDGGWDVIVHNAGITRDKTIANMKPEFWSSVVNINLSSQERINDAMLSCGALRHGGRIVCVSSISGIAGNRGQSNYALSKAGVIGMVETMAPLLVDRGITINAVAPGFIETKMTASIPFAVREAGRRLNSMSQGGLAIDVAETIAWLASPESNGVNGNVVRVCGQSILGA